MYDESKKVKYFSGPLNLCRRTKQADTVMGTELILSDAEFDMLDMLATREGEPVTFEQLYDAVWKTPDGADNHSAALKSLNNLIEQVRVAGESFMMIEYSPESGYTFKTHWGHNWQSRQVKEEPFEPFILPSGEIIVPGVSQARDKRLVAGLLVGAGAAAVAVVLIFTAVFRDISADPFTIEDEKVPLIAVMSIPEASLLPDTDDFDQEEIAMDDEEDQDLTEK